MSQKEYVPILLQIIHKNCPPTPENCEGGVYVGTAGIAYSFYHVAMSGAFEENREQFLNTAEKYIKVCVNINSILRTVLNLSKEGQSAIL